MYICNLYICVCLNRTEKLQHLKTGTDPKE